MVLAYMGTRGRYNTTLPLAMMAVAMQTVAPSKFVLFDDNEEDKRIDIRNDPTLAYVLAIMEHKGIKWSVVYGERKGPHWNHFQANRMGLDLCWRIDDDTVPEPDVLEKLIREMKKDVGAVGCSILTPPFVNTVGSSKLEDLGMPNKQWSEISRTEEVDHLHCSFLYRAGIADYNQVLSRSAFREETLFTWQLRQEGYRILITPGKVWHLHNKEGGIRSSAKENEEEMYAHDENVFQGHLKYGKLFVLNNGIGDHFVFKSLLPKIKDKYDKYTIACCYPEVFEGENVISIAEAETLVNKELYDVYRFCIDLGTKDKRAVSILEAYKIMYRLC